MNHWEPKLKLLAILSTTKELLLRSPVDGWPDESPIEAAEDIDKMIAFLLEPDKTTLPRFATTFYAPTGPIQEIAMQNGWHNAYMALADEFDVLEYLLHETK